MSLKFGGKNNNYNNQKKYIKVFPYRKRKDLNNNGHFPDLVYDILRQSGGLNLVLWLAKPHTFMAMLNITLK